MKKDDQFPAKLYKLLEEEDSALEWLSHGRAFRIVDRTALLENDVPKHFKQTKFSSFVRQLNLWGYKRLQGRDQGAWWNEHFLRGLPHRMRHMRRRKVSGRKRGQDEEADPDFYSMPPLPLPGAPQSSSAERAASRRDGPRREVFFGCREVSSGSTSAASLALVDERRFQPMRSSDWGAVVSPTSSPQIARAATSEGVASQLLDSNRPCLAERCGDAFCPPSRTGCEFDPLPHRLTPDDVYLAALSTLSPADRDAIERRAKERAVLSRVVVEPLSLEDEVSFDGLIHCLDHVIRILE